MGEEAPWTPPLVEMTGGIVGHLLAWERLLRPCPPTQGYVDRSWHLAVGICQRIVSRLLQVTHESQAC
jgi:hypothetical protein